MKILSIIIIGISLGWFMKDRLPVLYQYEPPTVILFSQKPLTETEIIAKSKHPEELLVIWTLESSQGKNDGCKRSGKVNGFGYRQNSSEFMCYDTFQEVVNEVDAWLTRKDALNYCMYNEGKARTDCPYAITALKLLEE